jgi:hypothetical protein
MYRSKFLAAALLCEIVMSGSSVHGMRVAARDADATATELSRAEARLEFFEGQYLLSQTMYSYHAGLNLFYIDDTATINGNVWRNFIRVNRYLGGATNVDIPGLINQDGTPGPAISAFIDGPLVGTLYVQNGVNNAATFQNFIGPYTVQSMLDLGNGVLSSAMKKMRDFIVSHNTDLANILMSIGESDVGGLAGSSVHGNIDLVDAEAVRKLLFLFFGGVDTFESIGITAAAAELFDGNTERVERAIVWALSNMP